MALYHLHWDYVEQYTCVLPVTVQNEFFKTLKFPRVCLTVSQNNRVRLSPPILVDRIGGSSIYFGNNVKIDTETVKMDQYGTLPAYFVRGFIAGEHEANGMQKVASIVPYIRSRKFSDLAIRTGEKAAKDIQRAWRRCISDPAYAACRRRLMREYTEWK